MICDRCEKDWDGRPWSMADVTSGEVHGYCEPCAVVKIDEYIAAKKASVVQARE